MFWPHIEIALRGHQIFRQAREGGGDHRIDGDTIARQLLCGNNGKGSNSGLGGAVVGLPSVAIDARGEVVLIKRPLKGIYGCFASESNGSA